MKTLVFIGMLFLVFACAQQKKGESVRYSLEEIGQEMTEMEQLVKDIKAFHTPRLATKNAEELQGDWYNRFFASMDEYNYYKLPTYKLDIQKLYANPDAEQVKNCITEGDFVNVIAVKDGEAVIRLKCKKLENRWVEIGGTYEYGDVIGWMRDSLSNANTKEYKILTVGELEFVTYMKDGKDLYFSIQGRPYSAGQLCEYVVNSYNNWTEE